MPQSHSSVDVQSLNIAWPNCPTCETPRILIVEDEMLIADLIDDIVRGIGYAVSGKAHDLLSARQELGKRNFDAVLLDIGLDGQHNPELADWLLAMDIPFAFVTGYDHPFEARHDKVPLLQKPFTVARLRDVMNMLVGPALARVARWPPIHTLPCRDHGPSKP